MQPMSRSPSSRKGRRVAEDYRHKDKKALLRPESGAQDVFPEGKRKQPRQYRFDSSLSPELAWDEAEARGKAEALIADILKADSLEKAQEAGRRLQSMSAPFLNWSGKAEGNRITVPTLPLFIHERLSTRAVLETLKRRHPMRGATLDLFGEGNKSIGDKIHGAYEHQNGWQNRMILGDSLQVMNSMLEYESMGGKVQMVYMDPPYGIRFGSNFQPFVRKRDVKDGDDASISREPEMVQAYRDTWTLGIHSWLTYMRDRLLLAREMLTDSGSCFVQISEENVHHVRETMDEVFGAENFVSLIYFATTSGFASSQISRLGDYLCWYAKDKNHVKYHQLYTEKVPPGHGDAAYRHIELPDGTRRAMTTAEHSGTTPLPEGGRIFRYDNSQSQGAASEDTPIEIGGKVFRPLSNQHWKASWPEGMNNLKLANRLNTAGNKLWYVRYLNDYPVREITNSWMDTSFSGFTSDKQYVVQTNTKVIQRCMLMTTDPGDLVFDPTCGSGTTAYVAEQWGRRWITTDVSRVPLALARQRLLTATYPYYELRDEQHGPSDGFVYKRKQNKKGEEVGGIVPHVTLKSIANDEPPAEEVLVDKPETRTNTVRITGPFCVEAVLPTPISPEAKADRKLQVRETSPEGFGYIPRMVKALSMSPELQLPGNQTIKLDKVRPPARSMNLHAEAEHTDIKDERIAVVFGPENGPISELAVVEAIKEAKHKDYHLLLVIAFAIEPEARQTVAQAETTFSVSAIYAQATPDLMMPDLLKNTRASQLFAITGLPDVELHKLREKDEDGSDLWQVTLNGLDTFDPAEMKTRSLAGDDVPCWMLDTDYDGQCFRAGQIFFPRTAAWDKIKQAIRADFSDAVWDALKSNVSAPFIPGAQIAVKVLDDRGNELLVIKRIEDEEKS